MKLVVTGALGHIGSSLIRQLPVQFPDSEIVLIDNLLTQRYCSLFDLPSSGRYRFVEGDILTANLPELFSGAATVIHLAAMTNAQESIDIRDEVIRVNFAGAERVAAACIASRAPLVFASTTSVYGVRTEVVDEDSPVDLSSAQSPYAESKILAERRLDDLASSGGLRCVIFRFGTIFGASPGMRFHTAVNKFCWQAAMGLPITVWRTALHQKRPYLDLCDAVSAISLAIKNDLFDGRIYNAVTANLTVHDVLETIRGVSVEPRIEWVDSRIMNQLSYEVSCERFMREGFDIRGDIRRGIRETIDLIRAAQSVPLNI